MCDNVYKKLSRGKIRHLNPKWFLTLLVTEFMSSSTVSVSEFRFSLQEAYAPVMQEMVGVIDSQIVS